MATLEIHRPPQELGSLRAAGRSTGPATCRGRILNASRSLGLTWSSFFVAALCWFVDTAHAKAARCFTTDDGNYGCRFVATDRAGSFNISAPGKPTVTLNIIEPNTGYGFVNIGPRNISLPGRYLRDRSDPACWVNDSTRDKICAW